MERNPYVAEHAIIEEARKQKQDIFTFTPEYDGKVYEAFQDRLKSILESNKDWNEKAAEFLGLWEEVITTPEEKLGDKGQLPAIALVSLFEHSFHFFQTTVSKETQATIARQQVSLFSTIKNPELVNICKGIWAYYADPVRRKLVVNPSEKTEDDRIRSEMVQAMKTAAEAEMAKGKNANPDTLRYLSAYDTRSLDVQPDGDDLQYFATLYAHDHEPLTWEERAVDLQSEDKETDAEQLKEDETLLREIAGEPQDPGIEALETSTRMPPHIRLYTFHNDRLPTPESIDKGQVDLCITTSRQVLLHKHERTTEVLADRLPLPIMTRFINAMSMVRATREYIEAGDDKHQRKQLRAAAAEKFAKELCDQHSTLRLVVKVDLGPERYAIVSKALDRLVEADVQYLFFSYDINLGDE